MSGNLAICGITILGIGCILTFGSLLPNRVDLPFKVFFATGQLMVLIGLVVLFAAGVMFLFS